MENASKALIMAAGVLIALMILGALILMFSNLSNYQDTNIQTDREAQIVEFNNQYETYNRDDVRGSDLYSLLNKVVDYNRRKSEEATGNDEGQNLKFEAMTIKVKFPNQEQIEEKWTFDETIRLFNKNQLGLNNNQLQLNKSTSTNFKEMVEEKLTDIENSYGKTGISNLVAGISNLFPGENASEDRKNTAISLYNKNRGTNKKINNYNELEQNKTNISNDIGKYYEYIQFKRAYFKCTKTEYNKKTGRIIELDFEFNPNKTE